ncbi:hypothetical protein VTO42DRAFT_6334 [Malbranchea cinnamomea]
MASSSVLGKRRRAAATELSEEVTAPSRRRTRETKETRIHDGDDGDDPFISPKRRTRSQSAAITTHQTPSTDRTLRSKRTVSDESDTSPLDSASELKVHAVEVNDENVAPLEFHTPRAQRYRNALPVTPKHRVQVAAKPLTPRTPRTIKTPNSTPTVYSAARQLFVRSANPGRLVGRDSEREGLNRFIQNSIDAGRGGCLYVSGPPGTGKSALVGEVCRDLEDEKTIKVANVNCASMTSARDIFGWLIAELCDDSQVFRKSELERLRGMFLPKRSAGPLYLVTLDEIDHLLTSDLEILYTFFEWSLQRNSRLILIGIANALDLTERFLPRLKAKNLKPQLLPFLPYTPSQITKVITSRLQSLMPDESSAPNDYVPFLQPAAIQLCARKVASQSGDLRKAFDLVCRTIDLIERETIEKAAACKEPLVENSNLASPISPPSTPSSKLLAEYTAATAPRATVAHVARVTSAAFGNGTTERIQGLNLQQKAALCALIAFTRGRREAQDVPKTPTKWPRSNAPTVKRLFETYSTLCKRDNMLQPLSASEFRDVISSLEATGLVGEAQERGRGASLTFHTPTRTGRGASGSPFKSARDDKGLVCFVGEKEVESHLSGPGEGILRALLRQDL